jgi:hypothetical protein
MTTALTTMSGKARGIASGIFAGVLSAAMHAYSSLPSEATLPFLAHVVVAYLVGVPLFLAGLGGGMTGGIAASAASVVGLSFMLPMQIVLIYACLFALPALFLTFIALRANATQPAGRNEGYLLTAITIYPCVMFLIALAATVGQEGGLLGVTSRLVADSIKGQLDPDLAAAQAPTLNALARFLPSILGCGWIFVILLSVGLAQKLLERVGKNLRAPFALMEVRIPNWLIFAAAATGVVGIMAPAPYAYVGINLCILLCVPFFIVGLIIVHAYAASTRAKNLVLWTFYLFFAWLLPLVAVLGVVDQWFDFRRNLSAGTKQGG